MKPLLFILYPLPTIVCGGLLPHFRISVYIGLTEFYTLLLYGTLRILLYYVWFGTLTLSALKTEG